MRATLRRHRTHVLGHTIRRLKRRWGNGVVVRRVTLLSHGVIMRGVLGRGGWVVSRPLGV